MTIHSIEGIITEYVTEMVATDHRLQPWIKEAVIEATKGTGNLIDLEIDKATGTNAYKCFITYEVLAPFTTTDTRYLHTLVAYTINLLETEYE